ncbi:hypothetical protein ABPG74_019067 [Tetrahymena malaccensis]
MSQTGNYQQFNFRRVVFLPTHLYESQSFEIKIGEKVVDLLQCMYVVTDQSYSDHRIVQVQLQNFIEQSQDLPYYKIVCQLSKSHLEIQTGIVGDQYIFLGIQSSEQVNIKILSFDLSLVFECQIEHSIQQKQLEFFNTKSVQNYFDSEIDYHEPGIIYFLGTQIVIRIDLKQKQIITKLFEEEYKTLLRLLPITQNEFNYYFKSSKKDSLAGYDIKDQEFLIPFASMNNKIYQLNMHNLEIIRVTNILLQHKYNQAKCIISIFPVPIQLKERQRKQLSKWTFLIHNSTSKYTLYDWREQNLFQKISCKHEKYSKFCFSQRIFMLNNGFVVQFQNQHVNYYGYRADAQSAFQIDVYKKKGERNYQLEGQIINQGENSYFSYNFYIKNFFHPILYKNELTYPAYMEKTNQDYLFNSNFIGFHSFEQQTEKQAQYQLKEFDQTDYQTLSEQSIKFLTYQNNRKIILYRFYQNQITAQKYILKQDITSEIQEFAFNQNSFEQFKIIKNNQNYKVSYCKLQTDEFNISQIFYFENEIKCFSKFTFDQKTKQS